MKSKTIGFLVALSAASVALPALADNIPAADHYRMVEKGDAAMRASDSPQIPIIDHSRMSKQERRAPHYMTIKKEDAEMRTSEERRAATDHYRIVEQETSPMQALDSP